LAKVHNQISRGDLSRAVTAALGVSKPDVGGLERFSETCDIVMNPWGMPEWAYLRRERLQGFAGNVGAIAAEFGMSALVNPAGSNTIVVLEYAQLRGVQYQLQLAQEAVWSATLTVILPGGIFRDTRWPITNLGGAARIRTGTDASSILGTAIDVQLANIPIIAAPVILAPGWGVALVSFTVNTTVEYVFGWRERKAYPGELDSA